ncbi:inositol monophosphatase family protein [Anoxybacillus sp. B7M1]|uniref:inositol monophosphatase family protein n=1 Tax=unclassified Anoxybacillus TaxID=2639704 RepID=UPI0005CD1239|nr:MULTISPECIES: inositol monophosphatase family protein [unclassified Anoxybacillus]ANB57220.1 inositol monophosphatase family protein [Anoxybacillus sp. B2M1]ANB63239.1 inositol monophosphatase family protein [Anoxybacillus sp. B7M1]OQM46359.1 inositol monophosphatase [Anoxybacillus sp. UARK-01]
MSTNWEHIDKCAKEWIKEAGERIHQAFRKTLTIETKSSRSDLVTNVDKEVEQFFIERIRQTFPSHRVLGEEGFGDCISALDGIVWIIDPIDGTMNFIHQRRNFAISIGIFADGIGMLGYVYDVVHDELYYAQKGKGAFLNDQPLPVLQPVSIPEAIICLNASWIIENKQVDPKQLARLVQEVRGTRSYGSAALEMAYIAAGRLDAYLTMRLSPWDFAGGLVIVKEVGGLVTNIDGEPLDLLGPSSVFVSKPGLHREILQQYIRK